MHVTLSVMTIMLEVIYSWTGPAFGRLYASCHARDGHMCRSQITGKRQELGRVYAPLALPIPQTAQAGEFAACTAACQNALEGSVGFSDCQNVVQL
eukprot:3608979-Pyramimonas_sp.AAC.1